MGNPGAFHRSITLQSLTVFSLVAVLAADHVQGLDDGCTPFSCGHLQDIRPPFRRRGDPGECGVEAYELGCTSSKATIHINTGTYYVTAINYTGSYFWVVDPNFNTSSNCPLPQRNHLAYGYFGEIDSVSPPGLRYLVTQSYYRACFANCSRAVAKNSAYKPVACLSAKNSHVYVWVSYYGCMVEDLEPYCGCLANIPFGNEYSPDWLQLQNASYADIIQVISKGFTVQFPVDTTGPSASMKLRKNINLCLNNSISYFKEQSSGASIVNWTHAFFWSEVHFLECVTQYSNDHYYTTPFVLVVVTILSVIAVPKFFFVLCRFLLAPLAVWIFLAYKYWKTRIIIDAVEKFLRIQQMIGPTRYAYTDIVAISSHFRDKLGQGGYGTVYKGMLLPGGVHVAVKMLEGNSNCNGEDFISEVSTIGRIHHVNVVRLMGFCSEEMQRALVYEYMPNGSLDKYIFSTEKSFSWDKLNEIALGIARGINYLHQGCDMQILHFDIKPHNILLDNNFVPKVADFGLAKLYPRGDSFVPLSAMRGTVGYIAPEMISRSFGVISSKSDVYSFGMLLLEMAGGRRNADPNMGSSSQAYYPSWVYDQLTREEAGEISPVAADMHELEKKLCVVGLWCIQMRSRDRPTMSEVIEILEAGVDGLQMPSRPFFCDEGHIHVEDSYHFTSELTAVSEEELSVVSEENDV
ncbi:LEAF RUST 10 DISEASE-RESISTANCE LOCUS RECEPTOR-LIKE PROTEIN KINASE-like 2.4 [Hordeum vulgare subsp. vulgare]|uniref:Protein kinase domain-containing protein n=1 Tax=Hordeum vulgare subsp. vulgare TaxID=112509 RepID=A0A8I6WDI9_HORVV|nr:LEAF RUST 10 DISEASE-RESISTANCE LOCUS RECEPTOR-LIKE PROTEIN KINASE-like 2.4 [Hordeum vulgare subsp. vulgare]XP_044963119.1 LEAF RUST 10 DISEASE-RESISTANCE LOCUS RECEPTOR-LIKE PROTEIN KINASE-like 2.4 [Hordeum vulgare subsp. vulgare]XP_044964108.1 LEAF RUST 10 DISEASE-RESISTANCE LOCUS RECEPTOR-LIKE PROTEIN KINASE-like 2.4 [Hordeum vulgare subsp. vulgare]XP_044964325.1 LEAF RUST 10 DISEASE-RESISTANCE LOCUS RECEPTOR-LIKE PROTEIN KINASE-like 2.4 [Hordeum vulgare subsp. vulgare]XP_044964782.1 LEAF